MRRKNKPKYSPFVRISGSFRHTLCVSFLYQHQLIRPAFQFYFEGLIRARVRISWRQRHNFHFLAEIFLKTVSYIFISFRNATPKCFWCAKLVLSLCICLFFPLRAHLSHGLRFDVLITVEYFTTPITIIFYRKTNSDFYDSEKSTFHIGLH